MRTAEAVRRGLGTDGIAGRPVPIAVLGFLFDMVSDGYFLPLGENGRSSFAGVETGVLIETVLWCSSLLLARECSSVI